MSPANKKSPGARGVPQPFNRQAGHAPQRKPVVVQPKTAMSAQSVKRPIAPPVYRPQATPKAVQPKMANAAGKRTQPFAPPVYRPQQTPKVLQTKSSSTQPPQAGQALRQPVAPPVYRPEAKKLAQPKMASAAQAHMPPKATPVHRPQAKPLIPPTKPVQRKAQTVAQPASRSQSVQQKAGTSRTGVPAASPLSPSAIQLKGARGVVQMIPCQAHQVENCQLCGLVGLLSGNDGLSSITRNVLSFLPNNVDMANLSQTSKAIHETASAELDRRYRIEVHRKVETPFRKGVFSGIYERGQGFNWADLHVTGQLGQSMNSFDLVYILSHLYDWMQACHEETGVDGILEWHPTGAVVTKQVVELLACSLSGGLKLGYALTCQKWRKFMEKGERNKLAERLDLDILPEYFAFLDCLTGIQGVTIVARVKKKPLYVYSLLPDEQVKAIEQNMLDDSPKGKEWYSQYLAEYKNYQGYCPSIKVCINYKLIPKLIKAIESQQK